MFCTKCGTKIEEGGTFCPNCGTKLEIPVEQAAPSVAPVEQAAPSVAPVEQAAPSAAPVEQAAPSVAPVEQAAPSATPVAPAAPKEKKPVNKKIFIFGGIGAAVLLGIILTIVLIVNLVGGSKKTGYIYVSDGHYYYTTNLNDKGSDVEIDNSRSDSSNYAELVTFSPDNKYIYFFTKYDSYSDAGTLNRVPVDKVKKGANLEKFIETIDTNVNTDFDFYENNLLYTKDDSILYFYNGKDSEKLSKNIERFTLIKDTVLFIQKNDGDSDLYAIKLDKLDDKVKIMSNVYTYYLTDDLNKFYASRYAYDEDRDDYTYTMYEVGVEKDQEKLFVASSIEKFDNGVFYYYKAGNPLVLMDYVNDTMASSDEAVKEPDYKDYQFPVYYHERMYSYSSLADDEVLVASCTKSVSFFSSWWSYYSIEEMAESDEEYASLCQEFFDKYKDREDEDGYFELTADVETDLKNLAIALEREDDWQQLCYKKYIGWYDTDYDSYYAARDAWYEVANRNSLRETLNTNTWSTKSLCSWKDGTETELVKEIVDYKRASGAMIFKTADSIGEKVDIVDITYTSDLYAHFYVDTKAENQILIYADMNVYTLSEDAAYEFDQLFSNGYSVSYVLCGNQMLMYGNKNIMVASISDNKIGSFKSIAEDAYFSRYNDDTIYYFADVYNNNGVTFGNLVTYKNGEKSTLCKDICTQSVRMFDDGSMLVITDLSSSYYGYGNYKYDYSLINAKGESTKVATDAYFLLCTSKNNFMYLSDGDLYVFNGKESSRVRSDVSFFLPSEIYYPNMILYSYN